MIDSTSETDVVGGKSTSHGCLFIDQEHRREQGRIYVAYRCAFQWRIKDSQGRWRETGEFPAAFAGLLPADWRAEFTRGMDLATLAAPFECWMGYSVGVASDHTEMLAAGRYGCVLTIMPTDILPWTTPPQEGERIIRVRWKQPGEDGSNGDTTGLSDGSYRLRLVQPSGWRDAYALQCAGHELMHALGAGGNHG